ncbi:MAG: hypothetical protein R3C28_26820 [Pirellulaceae bacterium]
MGHSRRRSCSNAFATTISAGRQASSWFYGTRIETIESVLEMHERAMAVLDDVPFVVFANKCDLQSKWQVTSDHLAMFEKGGTFANRAAKTGESVESGFQFLTDAMIAKDSSAE